MSLESLETRLVGATVVTQDGAGSVLVDGEVAFNSSGFITYVGPTRGAAGSGDHDFSGHILMPGLVNAHTHSAMTLLRGSCNDSDLATWLGVVQSLEQHMTAADVSVGLRLAMLEMIRTGTTSFADMYHWDASLIGNVLEAGMRVVAATAVFDFDTVGFQKVSPMTGRQALGHTEALATEFTGESRVQVRYGPHAPYTCSPEMLSEVASRAERSGLGVHVHLSESAFEVQQNVETHGRTPIMHAEHTGLLRVPVLVAHAVHATSEEVALLAERGAAVSHNPISNLKLGSGVAPLAEMRDAGVQLALGTDGAASNDDLDLFEEIKTGTLLHRGVTQDPEQTTGEGLLRMATSSGAMAVGLTGAGVLEPGRWADVIALRTDGPHATPMFSPASFLAFAARGSDVVASFVGGEQLMKDGVVTSIDESAVREDAARSAQRLLALSKE